MTVVKVYSDSGDIGVSGDSDDNGASDEGVVVTVVILVWVFSF